MCSIILVATFRIFAVTNPKAPIDVAPRITLMVATRRAELHCFWSTFNNVREKLARGPNVSCLHELLRRAPLAVARHDAVRQRSIARGLHCGMCARSTSARASRARSETRARKPRARSEPARASSQQVHRVKTCRAPFRRPPVLAFERQRNVLVEVSARESSQPAAKIRRA